MSVVELFEFEITRTNLFTESEVSDFVEWLESRRLYWGGGGGGHYIRGVISRLDGESVELSDLLSDLTSFFDRADRVVIRPLDTLRAKD